MVAPAVPASPPSSTPPSHPGDAVRTGSTPPTSAADAAETAVAARDVTYDYPRRRRRSGRRALAGVSFDVPAGSLFGFLGPNGSGKSTLFRLLATLQPVQAGRVTICGLDLATEPAAVRRVLGITFQNPGLDLHLTVEENLRHHGHLYGLRGAELARRMDEEMERFSVADRRGERAAALSGGLRRRVELAKALLSRPRVLLLDEPSTGLDPRARRDLGDALAALTAGGTSVLLTTHFIEEAERCHRLLLLDAGRVVAEGAPDELTRAVGGEVVTLAADEPELLLPDLTDALLEIGAEIGVTFATPRLAAAGAGGGGARFELVGGAAAPAAWETVGRLARRLDGWEQRVTAVTVARPNLEDVFLHHTGHGLHGEGPAENAAVRHGAAGDDRADGADPAADGEAAR